MTMTNPLTRNELRRAVNEANYIAPNAVWGRIETDESGELTLMVCPAAHICLQRGLRFDLLGMSGAVAGLIQPRESYDYLIPDIDSLVEATEIWWMFIRYLQHTGLIDPAFEASAHAETYFLVHQTRILDKLKRRLGP